MYLGASDVVGCSVYGVEVGGMVDWLSSPTSHMVSTKAAVI